MEVPGEKPKDPQRVIYHFPADDLRSIPERLKSLHASPDRPAGNGPTFDEWSAIDRAVREQSSRWRYDPRQLPTRVARALLSRGWSRERLAELVVPVTEAINQAPGDEAHTLRRHGAPVTACAVTPDGRLAVSASDDHSLVLWDLLGIREVRVLTGHSAPVKACAITPDGRVMVSGSVDGTLRLWDLRSGQCLRTLSGGDGGSAQGAPISTCAISRDGRLLIAGGADAVLRIWDVQRGVLVSVLPGHRKHLWCCAITPDGRFLASGSVDATVRVYDLQRGALAFARQSQAGPVWSLAATPDSRLLIAGTDDGTLRAWDLHSGQEAFVLPGHQGPVLCCAVDQSGAKLISGSEDSTLRLWDLRDRREAMSLFGHRAAVASCAVTPDGKWAVTGGRDSAVKIWDLVSWRELPCALTSDGGRVLAGWEREALALFDLRSGATVLSSRESHSAEIVECVAVPDSNYAMSRARNGEHKFWELEDPKDPKNPRLLRCIDTAKGPGDYIFLPAADVPGGETRVGSSTKTWHIEFNPVPWPEPPPPREIPLEPPLGPDPLRAPRSGELHGESGPVEAGLRGHDTKVIPRGSYPGGAPALITQTEGEGELLFAWVHLADLQIGDGEGVILDALQQDLAQQRGQSVPELDALFLTGDLLHSGEAGEAAELRRALSAMADAMGVSLGRVFLVPGNHDVDRRHHVDRSLRRLLQSLRAGNEDLDESLQDPWEKEQLLSRFHGLRGLLPALGFGEQVTPEQALTGWTLPLGERGGLAVRLLGLNTSLLSMDDEDRGKLRLSRAALARIGAEIPSGQKDELVIALSHHPLAGDWLSERRELAAFLRQRAQVHLSGHVHEAATDSARSGAGNQLLRVTAGRGPTGTGYSVAAVLRGAEGRARLRVWPRRYHVAQARFVSDSERLAPGATFSEHALPRLNLRRT